jgi:hypothetical protein
MDNVQNCDSYITHAVGMAGTKTVGNRKGKLLVSDVMPIVVL